jgi:ribose transport system substrate-binding protein
MNLKRRLLAAAGMGLAVTLGFGAAYAADTGVAAGDTSGKRIVLSNFYAGNTWRQQMLKSWDQAAADAVKAGQIKESRIVNANNSASEQASQIQSLIVEGWDAIVIDPISPTALNGVIQEACDAHIVVVVFNETATAPCAYKLSNDYVEVGSAQAEFIGKQLNGKGDVLEIRGIAGTSADDDMHKGIVDGFAKYPGIKIVGSVHGNWTGTITQKEVSSILPSLPPIDAVVTQGGDGWGTYEAFKAAGRPIPTIIMGHRQDELALWADLVKANPKYDTISHNSTPATSRIAFWIAQQLLAGKTVPKDIVLKTSTIEKGDLDAWLKVMPEGSVAVFPYSQSWTAHLIDAMAAGQPQPKDPPPQPGDM